MNRRLSIPVVIMLAGAALVALCFGHAATVPSTAAVDQDRIVTVQGLLHLVDGDAIVEVLVVVQPREDADTRARDALHDLYPNAVEVDDEVVNRGSGDVQAEQFGTNGLVWDTRPALNYNGAGAPVGGDLAALLAPLQTWTDVPKSSFAYAYGGTTSRCPSLYVGCPGSFDGYNDVGWNDLPGGVLSVATYGVDIDEVDIIIDNVSFDWHTGPLPVPSGSFDLATVNLHELGHGAGLGHSSELDAVMYPSVDVGQAKRVLHQDDIDGLSSLYPAGSPLPTAPPPTPTTTPTTIPPTATPCPNTKVPLAGTCGTRTPTPMATPTPTPCAPEGCPPPEGMMEVDCDASAAGVQSDCSYAPGASFQVEVHVTEPPTGGYFQLQVKLGWTAGVVNYLPAAPSAEALWEQCDLAGSFNNWEDAYVPSVFIACSPLVPLVTGDTFTGAVFAFEFQCKNPPAPISPPASLEPDKSVLELISRLNEPEPAQGGTIFVDGRIQPIAPGLTDATVTCAEPTPSAVDTDGDGCSDAQEKGTSELLGGRRDYLSFWDFMDMWVNEQKDRRVNVIDIGVIVQRFGAVGDPNGDPLDPPQALTGYHVSADRSPPLGANLWNAGPPDGSINVIDLGAAIVQFGHSCA